MGNFSIRNVLWFIGSLPIGYFIGGAMGAILGVFLWVTFGLVLGRFVHHSPYSVIINTLLSVVFGILVSLPLVAAARKLFGRKMSFLIWGGIGAVIGIIVMFSYGTNIIFHPEIYANYNRFVLTPEGAVGDYSRANSPFSPYAEIYYGSGTGLLIGSALYALAGMVIAFHETIGKKRKPEDKKEFDEYSTFFKSYLKK